MFFLKKMVYTVCEIFGLGNLVCALAPRSNALMVGRGGLVLEPLEFRQFDHSRNCRASPQETAAASSGRGSRQQPNEKWEKG